MNKLYFKQSLVCLGIGALALTACVDNDYDVSNVNATVQIGQTDGKFSLPTSSTGGIELKNLFSIDDGSAVQEINGTYFINSDGKTDPSNIKIDEIKIKKPQTIKLEAKLQWDKTSPTSPVGVKSFVKKKQNVPDDAIFVYSIGDITKNAEITAKTDDAISKDLEQVDNIGFAPVIINMDINISGTNKEIFKQIHFTDLVLNLPTGLHISSCMFGEKESPGFKNLLDDADATIAEQLKTKAKEAGIIEISKRLEELSLPSTYDPNAIRPLSLELSFDAADVTSVAMEPNDNADGKAYFYKQKKNSNDSGAKLLGKIELSGSAYGGSATQIDNDVNTDLVKTKAYAYVTSGQITMEDITSSNWEKMIKVIVPSMEFKGTGEFNNDILVTSFSGKVQHIINDINDVELNELPDFLTDDANTPEEEKVTLDLSNPQVFLKLDVSSKTNNVFNGSIQTGVKLEAYQDVKGSNPKTQVQTNTVNTGVLSFTGKDEKSYTILKRLYSNTEKATDVSELPSDYAKIPELVNSIEHELVPGLGTFLTKVPNTVKVKGNNSEKINVVVDCENLKLPQDLDINFEYKVFTALSFGSSFKVTYKDKEDGMSKDFKDLEDMNFGGLEITAKFYSDLPLPVKLDVKAYDIDGNEIKKGLKLPSVDIPANAKGVERTLTFEPVAPYTFNDFIKGSNGAKKLDAIEYKALLGGSGIEQGKSLKPSQTIRLDDIQISLIGGLKIMDNEKKK